MHMYTVKVMDESGHVTSHDIDSQTHLKKFITQTASNPNLKFKVYQYGTNALMSVAMINQILK